MTGFAQVKGDIPRPQPGRQTHPSQYAGGFSLSLKSVNHRFLDLHFRLPSGTDGLEMQLRRMLKEAMARGHVEITLSLERSSGEGFSLNRELVGGYIAAFRAAASEFSLAADPDLNAVLRMPGALESTTENADGEIEGAVMGKVGEALTRLNQMREEEGRGIERELRQRMQQLSEASRAVQQHRRGVLQNYTERLQSRIQELIGTKVDHERVLQEAALLVDRSDIQEEIVRLENSRATFPRLLDGGGEVGKKLDFLLQEMNRESNTLLSKTSGLAGEALKITEAGLAMKVGDREIARAGAEPGMIRPAQAAGLHHFRPVGLGKIDAGQRSLEDGARSGFLHLLHHAVSARQRAEWQTVLLCLAQRIRKHE